MPSLFNRVLQGEDVEERATPVEEPADTSHAENSTGLIRADELPSAANAMAELFSEGASSASEEGRAAEAPGEMEAAQPEVSEPKEPRLKLQQSKKRRGIFSWLFGSGDSEPELTPTAPESAAPAAETITTPKSDNYPAIESELPAAGHVPVSEPTAEADSQQESSAATVSHEPYSADQAITAVEMDVPSSFEAGAAQEAVTAGEIRSDLPEENHSATEEIVQPPPSESNETSEVELPELQLPPSSDASLHKAGEITNDEAISDADLEIPAEVLQRTPQPIEPVRPSYRDWALDDKLASHREWVDSHGRSGQRADLSSADLEAADLISVNLRLADLHDANMRSADLLLADLRDACLVRADLEEACLVGANLEAANLEGASLETAMGLVPRQFAGANLRDALLAPQLMEFEALAKFARNARQAYRYFGTVTIASLLSWLLIGKTNDAQIISDSAVLPFLHSRAAAAALPTAEAYLIIPVVLFVLYLLFHFHLQRIWEAVQELPAIFPDGHVLGEDEPGIIVGLLRTHFRWMNAEASSTGLIERGVSLLLAYGVVPVTLLLFWARYLTRQEIHGTILQAALSAGAFGVSIYAITKVGRPQERWEIDNRRARKLAAQIRAVNPFSVAGVLCAFLLVISTGTVFGVPHDRARAPQYSAFSIRRWAPTVFASLGYDPYADLTEKQLSLAPRGWNGQDEQVSSVDGARLNGAKLRYAQAYGVFLVNAHMLHSNLQGAFLSRADLRSADLGESSLRFALLDQAHMQGANLDRSILDGADLRRADLRGANLSHSTLQNADLEDALLAGASLYGARLEGSTLNRADLQKADAREALLARAHMDHANLQGAYLWSAVLMEADLGGAQFASAILIDADLRGANLGGAQLGSAVLNDTNLSGSSLEGANLRGALGLTAAQVCSAKSRRGAQMDDALATEVQAQCGGLQ